MDEIPTCEPLQTGLVWGAGMLLQGQFGEGAAVDPDDWLQQAILAYAADNVSVEVNFRELVPEIRSGAERFTHLIHPYPAKLIASIPYLFLRCGTLVPHAGKVLDPFCGSGTVLLEAALAGKTADGADANPLARLITSAKLRPVGRRPLEEALGQILAQINAPATAPDVVNIVHWYEPGVIARLASLRAAILDISDPNVRLFFEMCLSACSRRVSLADPRLSVPVRLNRERLEIYGAKGKAAVERLDRLGEKQVGPVFRSIVLQNIERVAALLEETRMATTPTLFEDARKIGRDEGFYDLVITSPPYVGAQKYVRASSLQLGWLGLTPRGKLRSLEKLNIGREHYGISDYAEPQETGCDAADRILADVRDRNALRAHIASNYLLEMKAAFAEMARVTRRSGWLVLVSGRNLISGLCFDTPSYLEELAIGAGYKTRARLVDDIRSRGLMTKRNRTAGVISQEVVTIMQKHG